MLSVAAVNGKAGLKVPQKQPKLRRLWLNDGSCIRLRAQRKKHRIALSILSVAYATDKDERNANLDEVRCRNCACANDFREDSAKGPVSEQSCRHHLSPVCLRLLAQVLGLDAVGFLLSMFSLGAYSARRALQKPAASPVVVPP
jgi:hypothetical protein